MLLSLAGVVKHGRENCINDDRTNIFKGLTRDGSLAPNEAER